MTDLTADLQLHDPALFQQGFPHELFAQLRNEAPVFHSDHAHWADGYYNVVRHADVQAISRDSKTWGSQPNPFLMDESANADGSGGTELLLISMDPPDHTKMRKLVNRGFTPRRVRDLTEKIQGTVDRLIDNVADKGGCDLVSDIAVELPLQVIADLVGVPEEDRHQIFHWTETSFGFDQNVTPEQRNEATMSMYGYADQMCDLRRANPDDYDDLISVLIEGEVDGEKLTQLQIDLFFMLLQNAGSETTRNLITTGVVHLLQNPDQLTLLKSDMDNLIEPATEELLRSVSPVMVFTRTALTDTEVAGHAIAKGQRAALWYSSANYDNAAFSNPMQLDITRTPNDHVAFGAGGPHFCLGASLARLELHIMFREIFTRFVDLQMMGDPASFPRVWSNLVDGYAELPVTWSEVRPRQT